LKKSSGEQHAMTSCASCGEALETPLVCTACGVLHGVDPPPTPFAALGIEAAFELELRDLNKRLLRFSRKTHPDYFGNADAETRARAETHSATLNAAFELLSDPFRRADHLVESLGGPSEKDERQMPQAFLMEVLEWNEALEDARDSAPGSAQRAALAGLESELVARRETTMKAVALGLTPLPARDSAGLTELRRHLNAVRYLDRALRELRALRL
jgi:molecular chaperone HscB